MTDAATKNAQSRLDEMAKATFDKVQSLAESEARRQTGDGYLTEEEVNAVFQDAGLRPYRSGYMTLEIPLQITVKVRLPRAKVDAAVKDGTITRYLNTQASHIYTNTRVGPITVDHANVKGLNEPETTYTEPANADEYLARADKARAVLRTFAMNNVYAGKMWCSSGVSAALRRMEMDRLPQARYFDVTRETVYGPVTSQIYAFDAETAIAAMERNIKVEGITLLAEQIPWVEDSKFTVKQQENDS